ERLQGRLQAMDFETAAVTAPGFAVAGAASPGGLPLPRTLLLTTAEVAAALLPVQGTPFGRPEDPYLGVDVSTGGSVYYSSYRNGKPIRGLSGQDKAWLHNEVLAFFTDWREQNVGREPILADFCAYLEQVSIERARRAEQRGATGRTRRCLDIAERLTEYTIG